MAYVDVSGGLEKARSWETVRTQSEARGKSGIRYRYFVADNWQTITAGWRQRALV